MGVAVEVNGGKVTAYQAGFDIFTEPGKPPVFKPDKHLSIEKVNKDPDMVDRYGSFDRLIKNTAR